MGKGKNRLPGKQVTGIVSCQDNSLFRKQSGLENLPEVLFLIIQAFSKDSDYRNLMNTNLTAFQGIKSQTVRYTLSLPSSCNRTKGYKRTVSLMNIINSVKDKFKQVSMSIQDVKEQTVVKYAHLCEGIYKFHLCCSSSRLSPTFSFEVFSNIYHLVLEDISGTSTLILPLKKTAILELIDCNFHTLEEVNPSKNLQQLKIVDSAIYSYVYVPACLDDITHVEINGTGSYAIGIKFKFPRNCAVFEMKLTSCCSFQICDLDPKFRYQSLSITARFPTEFEGELIRLSVYRSIKLCNKRKDVFPVFPPFYGKILHLEYFSLRKWIDQTFQNLTSLHLDDCRDLTDLPEIPLLETLSLYLC
jgi:hypothetical protein